MKKPKRCTYCIMDNSSDETISFDDKGECNYCSHAREIKDRVYFPNEIGEQLLHKTVAKIKSDENGKPYDCVMGISGGLDSSYLAYIGYKCGLRILGVHVDDGFDTDISAANIAKLADATNMQLEIVKPDLAQWHSLTKAYMEAGVPNIAIPQDNVTIAVIYEILKKYKLKYFLIGGNFALECILQRGNSHPYTDLTNIRAINDRFGHMAIDKLPLISDYSKRLDQVLYGITTPRLLNYVDYNRDRAFSELHDFCGFEYYGRKHLENKLTAFIQLYWFPKKFGVDKRTSHLSSMIASGQMMG